MNRRHLRLWWRLFVLCWTRERRLSALSLALIIVSIVIVALSALSVRATVDATTTARVPAAITAAVLAAVTYGLSILVQGSIHALVNATLDRIGRLELHAWIYSDIATIQGIDHLERAEYLDRVTIARSASSRIMAWVWYTILTVAGILELGVMLSLLSTVSVWLLLLLVFAAVPVWCNHRGQMSVTRAEMSTADDFRLQQELFELATKAASAKEIKIAGGDADIMDLQSGAWRSAMRGRFRAQLIASAWRLTGWLVFATVFIAAIALVAYRTSTGIGTVGDLVLTVIVATSLRQSLQNAVSSTLRTAGAVRLIEPYLWLRDYAQKQRSRQAGLLSAPDRLMSAITMRDVRFSYPGSERSTLDSVNVSLPAGSVVAIVGEYGSGKTTLVKLLLKLYEPESGTITVDGIDLASIDTTHWRSRTSAVFQDFARFHTTMAETIGLGDLPAVDDQDRIMAAVRVAGAEDLIARLPNGLQTQLGRSLGGVELSEGQWQRTALARASMRTAPLLFVLDEPTASLDAPSEQLIYERYLRRARTLAEQTGALTVVVSHRFSTVADADLILVMDRGGIVESGTHTELLRAGGRYADLYGMQSDAYTAP